SGRLPGLDTPSCQAERQASLDDPSRDLSEFKRLAQGRNIVWVVLESTGARALAAYGAERDITPHLSDLAHEALLVDWAYAVYPQSIRVFFSWFCARMPPPRTEASEYGAGRIDCRSIASELARAGYRTGLFHSGWFAYLGMDAVVQGRGFDELHDAATI